MAPKNDPTPEASERSEDVSPTNTRHSETNRAGEGQGSQSSTLPRPAISGAHSTKTGQEFSIDDDPTEYETDYLEQEAARASGSGTGSRQGSTLKRRTTAPHTILPRVDSTDEDEDKIQERPTSKDAQPEHDEADETPDDAEQDFADDDLSDAESFTLKDRQLAINQTHPFGIRIWKPALYKKNRSVEKGAEEDIHSSPSVRVSNWLAIFNIVWTLLFGWWLAVIALAAALVCFLFSFDPSAIEYGRVLASLSWYLLYPFGQFVKLESDENYAEEDEGEGRSISEYERWQSGDLEYGRLFFGPTDRSIVGRRRNSIDSANAHSSILVCTYRAVGLKYWKYTVDGTNIFLINLLVLVLFTILDYFVLDVAMGMENWLTNPALIFPLALFSVIPLAYFIGQAVASISAQSSMGVGAVVNAFFSTVVEVFLYCVALNDGKAQLVEGSIIGSIFAGILLLPGLSMCFGALKRKTQRFNVKSAGVTSTMLLFAVVAAFGPTLFYQIYGSHELKCKTCHYEPQDLDRDCRRCYYSQVAAVGDRFFIEAVRPYCWASAVMLFLAYMIGLWFTLRTHAAVIWSTDVDEKKPLPPIHTDVTASPAEYRQAVAANGHPLGTSSTGYASKGTIRDSHLYKRILGQSLRQVGLSAPGPDGTWDRELPAPSSEAPTDTEGQGPYVVPPKIDSVRNTTPTIVPGLSDEDNQNLVLQVAEMAATAATVAARDAVRLPRRQSYNTAHKPSSKPPTVRHATNVEESATTELGNSLTIEAAAAAPATGGGHDAPNWSKTKSTIILLVATVAYAIIAEILVDTVDVVLEGSDIDQKFLGLTLFALVPNTTEFLNAISFAMNGNIALSMEIGSAYALQVCLLQIPALVFFSAVHGRYIDPEDLASHTFYLIFPQWDMILVILSVLLLSNLLGEGKSNYFKGSILTFTYFVAILGFWFSGYDSLTNEGIDPYDTLAQQPAQKFWTKGRSSSGIAYPAREL
ncbi:putative calcium permease family membrane transporter [Phaeomoniella chlamydospora]|uniref:Putative calcium permease family membrane transporter n=1 Tax=Phaeomoniella chlamydospora TaxID=158046 RepID=A0A0G2E567_PHACM|nr:putative calcium permease family membrane transporter [Phaeomoniella chlamydospora]